MDECGSHMDFALIGESVCCVTELCACFLFTTTLMPQVNKMLEYHSVIPPKCLEMWFNSEFDISVNIILHFC